jgi:hypothetical protein
VSMWSSYNIGRDFASTSSSAAKTDMRHGNGRYYTDLRQDIGSALPRLTVLLKRYNRGVA